jgi:hypothetical protein
MRVEILAGDLADGLDRQGGRQAQQILRETRGKGGVSGKVYTLGCKEIMGKENQKEKAGNEVSKRKK